VKFKVEIEIDPRELSPHGLAVELYQIALVSSRGPWKELVEEGPSFVRNSDRDVIGRWEVCDEPTLPEPDKQPVPGDVIDLCQNERVVVEGTAARLDVFNEDSRAWEPHYRGELPLSPARARVWLATCHHRLKAPVMEVLTGRRLAA
jgi:hypothetical protein